MNGIFFQQMQESQERRGNGARKRPDKAAQPPGKPFTGAHRHSPQRKIIHQPTEDQP